MQMFFCEEKRERERKRVEWSECLFGASELRRDATRRWHGGFNMARGDLCKTMSKITSGMSGCGGAARELGDPNRREETRREEEQGARDTLVARHPCGTIIVGHEQTQRHLSPSRARGRRETRPAVELSTLDSQKSRPK